MVPVRETTTARWAFGRVQIPALDNLLNIPYNHMIMICEDATLKARLRHRFFCWACSLILGQKLRFASAFVAALA
jgi:hypothetical protein